MVVDTSAGFAVVTCFAVVVSPVRFAHHACTLLRWNHRPPRAATASTAKTIQRTAPATESPPAAASPASEVGDVAGDDELPDADGGGDEAPEEAGGGGDDVPEEAGGGDDALAGAEHELSLCVHCVPAVTRWPTCVR